MVLKMMIVSCGSIAILVVGVRRMFIVLDVIMDYICHVCSTLHGVHDLSCSFVNSRLICDSYYSSGNCPIRVNNFDHKSWTFFCALQFFPEQLIAVNFVNIQGVSNAICRNDLPHIVYFQVVKTQEMMSTIFCRRRYSRSIRTQFPKQMFQTKLSLFLNILARLVCQINN